MDDDLKAVFEKIRSEDRRAAPTFRRVLQPDHQRRATPARWSGRLRLAAAVAATVALGLVLVLPIRDRGLVAPRIDSEIEVSVMWRAPSDFLLSTPGSEVVSDLPRLGRATPFEYSQMAR